MKTKIFITVILQFIFILILNAQVTQEWVSRYDGPMGNGQDLAISVAVDNSGNVYVTGLSWGSGTERDFATIKYNSAGVQQWVSRYNGPGNSNDEAYAIAVDGSGNVYVTGRSRSGSSSETLDYATIKYNPTGVQQWVSRYNGPGNSEDSPYSIAIDGSGNVYVVGYSTGNGTNYDYAIVKYNSLGIEQWVARYNGPGNHKDMTGFMTVDILGNVYVTGISRSGTAEGTEDYATIKYNSSGIQQWISRYNGPGNGKDEAYSIAVDGSGSVYVTGHSYNSGTDKDYATIKYNSAGIEQWVSRYNGPGNTSDMGSSIKVDGAGNVYIIGESVVSGTTRDFTAIKYNSSGVQQWVSKYNGPADDGDWGWVPSLAIDNLGNTYVTALSYGNGIGNDYAIIKYNSTGVQQWVQTYNGPENGSDGVRSITVDGLSNVYVTGRSKGIGTNSDFATIKYSQTLSSVPTISSFSPTSGPIGTAVTINGTNFSTTPASNIVYFGAVRATVKAATSTTLSVTVPTGATYQPITVTVNGLTAYSSKPFIVTFLDGGKIDLNTFPSKVDFTTGTNPNGVATGDIDGDGKPDMVVVNTYGNTVSVFRNTSSSGSITSGSFAAKVDFTTENPIDLVIADIDGDGKLDLAVLNASVNTVSVFRNTSTSGSISFGASITFATGARPYFAAIGDLDGDGKPDLVVANHDNHIVSVFRNTSSSGSISFAAKVDFATGQYPWGIAIGDIDGDGKQDLVVCKSGSNVISVFRNTSSLGSITFATNVDFTTGMVPVGVAIGDIDGDGKPDMVITNQSSSTVSIFRNTSSSGAITFTAKVDFATGATPYIVAINDIDGDGKPDMVVVNANLVVGSENKSTVSIFRNTSTSGSITSGSFAAKVDFNTGTAPKYVAIGDVDGDGKPDLIVTNSGSNKVSLLRNTVSTEIVSGQEFPIATGNENTIAGSVAFDGTNYMIGIQGDEVNPNSITVQIIAANGNLVGNRIKLGKVGQGPLVAFDGSNYLIVFADLSNILYGQFIDKSGNLIGVAFPISGNAIIGDGRGGRIAFGENAYLVEWRKNNVHYGQLIDKSGNLIGTQIQISTKPGRDNALAFDGNNYLMVWCDNNNKDIYGQFISKSGALVGSNFLIDGGPYDSDNPVSIAFDGSRYMVCFHDQAGLNSHKWNLFARFITSSGVVSSDRITICDSTKSPGYPYIAFDGSNYLITWVENYYSTNAKSVCKLFNTSGIPVGTALILFDSLNSKVPLYTTVIFDGNRYLAVTNRVKLNIGPDGVQIILSDVDVYGRFIPTINNSQPPTISSFSPTSGPIGTAVTINGTNFSTTPASNIVYFGAVRATVKAATSTSLSVTVPTGATYQPVTVTVNSLTAYSNAPFIVTFAGGGAINSNSFSTKIDFATAINPDRIALGDIDGDGKPDLVVCNSGSSIVSVFRNTSASGSITSNSFAAKVDFTIGLGSNNIAIGDLDGDGKLDLVITNGNGNSVSLLRNLSTSGSISFASKVDFESGKTPYSVAMGDLDGDGKPDIAVCNQNSNTVSVFRNTSTTGSINSGSFAAKVDFTTGTTPWGVAISDIDGGGKPDLIIASIGSNTVSIFRNTSATGSITSSSFAAKVDFTTGVGPYDVAIGDIDGDGKPDLVVGIYNSNTISVYRNTSNSGSITSSSFSAKVDFGAGVKPLGVAIGDLDGDGKPDLAIANVNSNTVSVFKNTSSSGSISLTAKIDFSPGTYPTHVVFGDIDGDGKPDLVVGNLSSNTVSVFRNTFSQSLIGTWDKVSGPGDPIRYNFQTDSKVLIHFQTRVDTADYATFSIPSSDLRGIDLGRNGVVGWRGVYKLSSDDSALHIEGYWYTGRPPVATPTSFSTPASYTKVTSTGLSVQPYTSDANTVLLDHFDGTSGASILAYSENFAACGPAKPSAIPSFSYVVGPNGLNQALSLNAPTGQPIGSASYLQYPGGQLLSQPNGTVEFWVFLTTYGIKSVSLVDQGPFIGSCTGWTFYMSVDSTGQLKAGAWDAFTLTSGLVKVPLNRWTHLATTWGSAGARLYINGVLVGTDANTKMPAAGYSGSVLISPRSIAGAAGSIDELRISNVQRTTFNVGSSENNTQIPNGGFEVWENYPDHSNPNNVYQKPDKWIGSLPKSPLTYSFSIEKNTDNYPVGTGQYSMIIKNDNRNGVSGVAMSYDIPPKVDLKVSKPPAFSINFRPKFLCLYYKYLPVNGDSMTVGCLFFKNGVNIGDATYITSQNVLNWTSLKIPVNFYTTDIPDSATIFLSTSRYIRQDGSKLYVDNLSFDNLITDVPHPSYVLPSKFNLSQNYPNPFNPTTKIKFGLPETAFTKLTIYDILGREVDVLIDKEVSAGYHEVNFDASNLPSGVYFYRIQAGEFLSVKKMLLIK